MNNHSWRMGFFTLFIAGTVCAGNHQIDSGPSEDTGELTVTPLVPRCQELVRQFVRDSVQQVVRPFYAYHYTHDKYVGSKSASEFISTVAADGFRYKQTNYGEGLYLALDPTSSRMFGFEDRHSNGVVDPANEKSSRLIAVRFKEGCRMLDLRDAKKIPVLKKDMDLCPDLLDQADEGKIDRSSFYKNLIQDRVYGNFGRAELKAAGVEATAYPYGTALKLAKNHKSLKEASDTYALILQGEGCADLTGSHMWSSTQMNTNSSHAWVIRYYRGLPQKTRAHQIPMLTADAKQLQENNLDEIIKWAKENVAAEIPFTRLTIKKISEKTH